MDEVMEKISHRTLDVNGIKMHIAEQGTGPVVLLLHGFPSFWYSWRHQIPVLAKAGYHVVAPDLRGYGLTEAPPDPTHYTALHIAGDVVGLIHALGEKQVYLVGHDWGAIIAWHTTQFRPDLVKGIVNLSVGFLPRHPDLSILDLMRAIEGEQAYMLEWQEPGKAEADFNRDIKLAFYKLYSSMKAEIPKATDTKSVLENLPTPEKLPSWITEEEIQQYVDTFSRTGFTPALNYYRNLQRTWELTAPWTGIGTSVPGLVIIGDMDLAFKLAKPYLDSPAFKIECPNSEFKIVPGHGHFIQEEAPEAVNGLLLDFFNSSI